MAQIYDITTGKFTAGVKKGVLTREVIPHPPLADSRLSDITGFKGERITLRSGAVVQLLEDVATPTSISQLRATGKLINTGAFIGEND